MCVLSESSAVQETGIQLIIEQKSFADGIHGSDKARIHRTSGVVDDDGVHVYVVAIESRVVQMRSTESHAVQEQEVADTFKRTCTRELLVRLSTHYVERRDLMWWPDFLRSSLTIVGSAFDGFCRWHRYFLQG